MIRYLLTEKNKYKGNLHCHTTLSDGQMTPEQIVNAYYDHGYAFVALSDHDRFYSHNDLQRDDFVVPNAYKQNVERKEKEREKCAKEQDHADVNTVKRSTCPD